MPARWTDKDERQYEHIKAGEREMGRSLKRSKQIAAATVNKRRASEGRTETTSAGAARTRKTAKRAKKTVKR
jgi:hypothetical protein